MTSGLRNARSQLNIIRIKPNSWSSAWRRGKSDDPLLQESMPATAVQFNLQRLVHGSYGQRPPFSTKRNRQIEDKLTQDNGNKLSTENMKRSPMRSTVSAFATRHRTAMCISLNNSFWFVQATRLFFVYRSIPSICHLEVLLARDQAIVREPCATESS